ncbi:MAG: hypothetical protein ACYDGM_02335, partial [Vulcanimicrobiaceae bacterium]
VCTCLFTVAVRLGASRIMRAGRFHHPFGDPSRTVEGEFQWRRAAVQTALHALTVRIEKPTLFEVDEYVLR